MKLTAEYLTIPREGETENGDAAFVRHDEGGGLLAVIDALGHGSRAAHAAAVAMKFLGEAPIGTGLRSLVDGLHEVLRGTRGAAAMLLQISGKKMEGCGVGNVEMRGLGTRIPAVLTPGVLGAQLGRVRFFEAPLSERGRIVMFSDGVSGRFTLDDLRALFTRDACRALMDRYRRPSDDATVLVTDFEA